MHSESFFCQLSSGDLSHNINANAISPSSFNTHLPVTHKSAVHKSFGFCNVLLNVVSGKTYAINYKFRILLHIHKASSFFL